MDIDLSTELEAIPRLIQSIESGGHDVAIGSRLKKGAVVTGRTLLREGYFEGLQSSVPDDVPDRIQ